MASHATAILVMLFAWWFSTGAILYLDGLPRRTYRWSFGAASLIALGALWGVAASAEDASPTGTYLAVMSALALWGWNEMAFLFGYLTGPRRRDAAPGARGLRRFRDAAATVIHHELALLATLAAIAALGWGGANPFALATFGLLFVMRLSTKLNIFLGVPNTTVEFLPAHLGYLKSYFRRAAMNLLFPVSVTAATLAAAWLVRQAVVADPALATGFALLATLAVLGVIEHWFLVLPLPVGELWSWGLRTHRAADLMQTTPVPAVAIEPATPRSVSPPSWVA